MRPLIHIILSPFEQEVAELARAGYGRNGIAAALGISSGTVKVVLRQIRWKLGDDWQNNPSWIWPGHEYDSPATANESSISTAESDMPVEENAAGYIAAALFEPDDKEGRWLKETQAGRHLAALLLIQGGPRKHLLKVSGLQRFLLRPALLDMEEKGYIRLLAADRNDLFSPPWLPIVHRGRRSIRAATYLVRNEVRVREGFDDFMRNGFQLYVENIMELIGTARQVASKWRKTSFPDVDDLKCMIDEAFGISNRE